MDKSWMCFLVVIFYFDVWINTVLSEGVCDHHCITDRTCKSVGVMDRCYYVFTDQLRNWYDSRSHCEGQQLSMAKIDNNLLFGKSYLSSLITNVPGTIKNNHAWLGAKASNFDKWTFVDDHHTPVNSGQFDLWPAFDFSEQWTDKTQCGCLSPGGPNFSVETQACDYKGYFLCRKKDCDISSEGNCLELVRDPKTWFDARSHCVGLGGDLFYMSTYEKFSTIGLNRYSQLYANISLVTYKVHIGMVHRLWKWNSHNRYDGTWSDGTSILHSNWAPGEPNDYEQECLMIYRNNEKWDDNYCIAQILTLCQGEIKKPKSSTPVSITLTPNEPTTIKTNNDSLTHPTAIPTSSMTEVPANKEGNGTASENFIGQNVDTSMVIIIIIGVLLGVFFLLSIALMSYFICKRGKKQNPQVENNVTASSHDIPESQSESHSPTADAYEYINSDEIPEKRPETTVRYQNMNSNDIPGQYLNSPLNWPPEDTPPENGNYQHLIKR